MEKTASSTEIIAGNDYIVPLLVQALSASKFQKRRMLAHFIELAIYEALDEAKPPTPNNR